METEKTSSAYIKVGIVLLFMFGFRFLPPIGVITPYGMAVLGILIGAILGWSFDGRSMTQTSLLAVVALATTDYPGGMMAIATNMLANYSLFAMIIGMLIAGAVVAAGVDNFLIAKIMNNKVAKGRPWVITFILVFAPYILSIFIFNAALILFLFPIYAKIFKEAGYKVGDKYVISVYLGAMLTAVCSNYIFPFLGIPLSFAGLVQMYTGATWSNADYMMTVTIFTFVVSVGYIFFMKLMRCDASKIVSVDLNVFGDANMKLTKHQSCVLWSMFAFIIGCIVFSFGSMMNNAVGQMLAKVGVVGWMCTVPAFMMIIRVEGKRLMNLDTATKAGFSWELILLVASATLVGGALTSAESGFGTFLTGVARPLLDGMGPYAMAILMFALVLLATNFCNNMAVMLIGFALIGSLAAGGMAINSVMLAAGVLVFSQLGFLLPASSMWGAILHTADMVTPMAIYKVVIPALIYILVVAAVVFVPLCLVVF